MGESTEQRGPVSPAVFHRSPGVADWRVTGSGPQAVFTARSLDHAARLIDPIVTAATRCDVLPDVDLRAEGLVVRVPYRDDEGIPARAAEFAAEVSRAAGGRLVDDSHAPAWWTPASPDNHGVDIASWTDTFE